MSVTLLIILVTVLISILAFSNPQLKASLIFYPPAVKNHNQWYRFITCGFIHADIMHLAFNMLALYSLGKSAEEDFVTVFQEKGRFLYFFLYLTALVVCLLPTYSKHRNDYHYASLGASGAVSAIVFAFMLFNPTAKLMMLPIPIPIPAYILGPLYLVMSSALEKRNMDNINHSAHFWGAVYGIFFLTVLCYTIGKFDVINHFIGEIRGY